MNFDSKFTNIVNALFLTQQAYITDAGMISELFKVERGQFKITAYADDLTIGISFQDDWLKFTVITKIYEAASNARVNKSKTVLVLIIAAVQECNLPSKEDFKKLTEDDPISILG
ncbi:16468_t:CDS:2, partial [Gigaspora rosea]